MTSESKSKLIKIILYILLFSFITFLIYRIILVTEYNKYTTTSDINNLIKGYTNISNWKMNIKKTSSNDSYLSYENIKIRNDFSDYQVDTESLSQDYSQKVFSKGINKFAITIENTNTCLLNITNFSDKNTSFLHLVKPYSNLKKIFKDNKINNDLDLVTFLVKNINSSNIFTSKSTMEKSYANKLMLVNYYSKTEGLVIINGDYKGYLIYNGNTKEAIILKDNQKYTFSFAGSEFTYNYINELLDTLLIN